MTNITILDTATRHVLCFIDARAAAGRWIVARVSPAWQTDNGVADIELRSLFRAIVGEYHRLSAA